MNTPEVSNEQRAAERFTRDTAGHAMTVLLDQGLHRHLRFARPGSSLYWFDLITVPGALVFQGDGDSYVFRRIRDMFAFFRGPAGRIDPVYWAEKLTDGRGSVKVYDREVFERRVAQELAQARRAGTTPRALGRVVREQILQSGEIEWEEGARRLVAEFAYYVKDTDRFDPRKAPDFVFADPHEWELRDYDWWYLWACHAIVWGIAQYDAARTPTTAPAPVTAVAA